MTSSNIDENWQKVREKSPRVWFGAKSKIAFYSITCCTDRCTCMWSGSTSGNKFLLNLSPNVMYWIDEGRESVAITDWIFDQIWSTGLICWLYSDHCVCYRTLLRVNRDCDGCAANGTPVWALRESPPYWGCTCFLPELLTQVRMVNRYRRSLCSAPLAILCSYLS